MKNWLSYQSTAIVSNYSYIHKKNEKHKGTMPQNANNHVQLMLLKEQIGI